MSGKEILLKTLRREAAERVPWVPFVGVHGGYLIGVDAESYLKSADHIVAGQTAAAERYQADGLPVVFDLQVEAEILGCELHWAKDSPPSVRAHPLGRAETIELDAIPEFSVSRGRFPLILEATRRLSAGIGDRVALYGLVTGPLTLAMHLRGEKLFTDLFDFPDTVEVLLDRCADVAIASAKAYLEAGADVVAVVDPINSLISPAHFEQFVSEPLNRIFNAVHAARGLSSLFVCGNASRNLEAMAETACDSISIDENVDLQQLKELCLDENKSFGGNLKLTTSLLLGNPNDARRDAVACYDTGYARGYVLAPGCDLPYAVPPENLDVIASIARDPYQRDIARKLPPKDRDDDYADIAIPDYARNGTIRIDVVTLDSAGCAPCAYMLDSARQAAIASGLDVDVTERKITVREGLAFMAKLGVDAIPTICIQGKPTFSSRVPDRRELLAAIANAFK